VMDEVIEKIKTGQSSPEELKQRETINHLFRESQIPEYEIMRNLGLFVNRQTMSRYLFFRELYEKILNIHGVVMEFGVRWGQNLALFSNFRGIYEPYNHTRKVIGFDTFSGFPSVSDKDGTDEIIKVGALKVAENYEDYLDRVLAYHESESPLSHIKKYEIVKGDATETLEKYLKDHPETIIALAYIDLDLYEPTKKCLELMKNHLTKGSVIGFDELNYPQFPGETLALKEVFGLDGYSIRRSPLAPMPSYIVIE
jgi:Macrocin-O-methyltransferase (TylF)